MKKTLFLVIIMTFMALPLHSQKTKDALYLRNGSIIYGRLMEISENNYKMQTSDGSLFVYSQDEVEKFVKESPAFGGRKISGAGFGLEAGLLIGSQRTDYEAPFSFNFLVNLTSKTKNSLAFGSGVEFLGSAYTPFFLEYRHLFYDRKTTPFIFFRGGGLFHLGGDEDNETMSGPYSSYNYPTDYKGGPSLGMGTGISWSRNDGETYLSFGYRYASTSYKQRNYNEHLYTYKSNYNRLEIKFGFRF